MRIILIILVLIILVTFVLQYLKKDIESKKKENCTKLVTAQVIEIRQSKPNRKGKISYKPIFIVRDERGSTMIVSARYSQVANIPVNSTINLLVDPNNYNRFIYADSFLNEQ